MVQLQEHLARAKLRALAQGVRVWRLENGATPRYAVPSKSLGGLAYEVVVRDGDGGNVTCSCPGALNRGVCKHIGAVLVRLEVERELEQSQSSL